MEKHSKQHCWHCAAVSDEAGVALLLRPHTEPGLLEISPVPLAELLEQTLELIGTNINANPYGECAWAAPKGFCSGSELCPAPAQPKLLRQESGCGEGREGCLRALAPRHLRELTC